MLALTTAAGLLRTSDALSCQRCSETTCNIPDGCECGVVKDVCGCCDECAKTEDQECGGPWGGGGVCGEGMTCSEGPGSERYGVCQGKCSLTDGEPHNCCMAETAQCWACKAGLSLDDYCEISGNAEKAGCDMDPLPICCLGLTAECLACAEEQTVDQFCKNPDNHDVLGCGDDANICCTAMTAMCLACKDNQTLQQYCNDHPDTHGCPESYMTTIYDDSRKGFSSSQALRALATIA